MIIVYGTRCYGKSDVIEGLGHVTTRFVHIMFVPLVPIETVFILPDDRGMKLPFSFKSALSGWLRAGAILGGLGTLAGGIAALAEEEILGGIVLVVMGLLMFGSFWLWGMLFGKCSPQRKAELLGLFGIDPSEHGVPSAAAPAPAQQGYGQQQQQGYGQQQPAYGQPPAYGQQPGYGAPPPPAYGAPPAGGFGNPQPQPGGYGAPLPYGAAPGYGAPPAAPGYGAPPGPPGYGAPQGHGPSAPPAAPQGYGGPQPGGYGAPPPGYGPQGWDPNRR